MSLATASSRFQELEQLHDREMFRWLKRSRNGETVESITESYGFHPDDEEYEEAFDFILYAIEDAAWG